MTNDKRDFLIIPVAFVVLIAWLSSLVDALLTQSYTALTFTTPLMLALAGFVFGVQIIKKANGGNNGK
jgi:hypothetical protein